eukprot:610665-Prymnesium_polylepis.1
MAVASSQGWSTPTACVIVTCAGLCRPCWRAGLSPSKPFLLESTRGRDASTSILTGRCGLVTRNYNTAHLAQEPATHGLEAMDPSPTVDS